MGRADSPLRDRLVFIVGARRSGTNLLQRVLATHPDVALIPSETFLFHHGIRALFDLVQHSAAGSARTGRIYVQREEFLDAVRDLCDRIYSGVVGAEASAARILERTPHHAYDVDLIAAVYPDARVLHIIRDGRDVARSLTVQDWGPASLAEAAEEWRSAVTAARDAGSAFSGYREVRYERLCAATEETVEGLFAWLDLPVDAAVISTAMAELDIRFNVNPGGAVGVSKWRSEWRPADLTRFDQVAGDLLSDLGYQPSAGLPERAMPGGRRLALRRPNLRRRLDRLEESRAERRALKRLDRSQILLDELFELVVADRLDELPRILAPNVRVAFSDGSSSWDARGTDAVERLRRLFEEDEPMRRGRQVRGDVLPAIPTTTLVATYELGGALHERVLAVTVQGDLVTRVLFHRSAPAP
ncbi:MAG: hypothetical protein QOJ09_2091 [Actinomycetota bacterium]|nr:hypothetical protein [Actinomycetota bacterium]